MLFRVPDGRRLHAKSFIVANSAAVSSEHLALLQSERMLFRLLR